MTVNIYCQLDTIYYGASVENIEISDYIACGDQIIHERI